MPQISLREKWGAFLILVLVCGGLIFAMGRDLNWDYFNYHDYLASLNFQDRLTQDFFAAGYQGYQNPLPYLPLEIMLRLDVHSLILAWVLGIIASLNLYFVYLISRTFFTNDGHGVLLSTLVVISGGVSGIFLSQMGSTFVDPLTTPFVMMGLYMAICNPRAKELAIASCFIGFATGLKLTNAPYAVAWMISVPFFIQLSSMKEKIKIASMGVFCVGLGFLIAYGYWGFRLFQTFGSPVFPLFNGIFHAIDFPSFNVSYHRFIPVSLEGWLAKPLEWAKLQSWALTETLGAEIRPLIYLSLLPFSLLAWRQCVISGTKLPLFIGIHGLQIFFWISALLWMMTSANGRYGLPIFFLLSLFLIAAIRRLSVSNMSLMGVVVFVFLQTVYALESGNPRWNPHHWTSNWLPHTLPVDMESRPGLYLTIDKSSESYFARWVHPRSAFVNPIGLMSIRSDAEGWGRFLATLDKYRANTRVVFHIDSEELTDANIEYLDRKIDRLGISIDAASCRLLPINFAENSIHAPWVEEKKDAVYRSLVLCQALFQKPSSKLASERQLAERIMNAYERKCPKYFYPPMVQLESDTSPGSWIRNYEKYDLEVRVNFKTDRISYVQPRQFLEVPIGSLKHWQEDVEAFECKLPFGGKKGFSTLR